MYSEFAKKAFARQFMYRANAIFRLLRSFLRLFVTVSIWSALYRGKTAVDGVSFREMLTYVLMAEIVGTIIQLSLSSYIAGRAADGSISIDMIRPASPFLTAFADRLGQAGSRLLLFSIPMFTAGVLIWGFVLPAHVW